MDQLTLAEIAVLCDDGKPENLSEEQIEARGERWRSLTPKERIAEARRARGF